MSDLLTNNDIVLNLAELGRQLSDLTEKADVADRVYVDAKHAFEIAWARAILTVEASNAETRKAHATLETQQQARALADAEFEVRSLKRAVDQRKVRIDLGRTMSAAIRSEMAVS